MKYLSKTQNKFFIALKADCCDESNQNTDLRNDLLSRGLPGKMKATIILLILAVTLISCKTLVVDYVDETTATLSYSDNGAGHKLKAGPAKLTVGHYITPSSKKRKWKISRYDLNGTPGIEISHYIWDSLTGKKYKEEYIMSDKVSYSSLCFQTFIHNKTSIPLSNYTISVKVPKNFNVESHEFYGVRKEGDFLMRKIDGITINKKNIGSAIIITTKPITVPGNNWSWLNLYGKYKIPKAP